MGNWLAVGKPKYLNYILESLKLIPKWGFDCWTGLNGDILWQKITLFGCREAAEIQATYLTKSTDN